jgi:hypothetical protein
MIVISIIIIVGIIGEDAKTGRLTNKKPELHFENYHPSVQ